jgi:hypothetical protein
MRRLHLVLGILTLLAFLTTGQIMRLHQPPLSTLTDATRLLYRSRHIYILGAGLVNLMLGLYLQPAFPGWRRITQTVGSALVLLAPVLLVLGFATEPRTGLPLEQGWASAGLYSLFGGSLLHAVAHIGKPAKPGL